MKMSRGVSLVGLSAAIVSAGWVVGSGVFTPPQALAPLTQGPVAGAASSAATSPAAAATPAAIAPSVTPAPSVTLDPVVTPAPAPAAPSGTFDGDPVNTRYGTFQAQITVANGTITDVALLQTGDRDGTSRSINSYAIPQLTKEVLTAQSAKVQAISGASYTSDGFLNTVASAIATAGLS